MLERGSVCLQRGALHRLAEASSCRYSSRRMLHCGFWVHGAGHLEIALSALSEAVGLEKSRFMHRHNTDVGQSPGQVGTFLDFLYPSKTIATIRSYSKCQSSLPSRSNGKASRKARRTFSSLAADTLKPSSSEVKQHPYPSSLNKPTTTSTILPQSLNTPPVPSTKTLRQIEGVKVEPDIAWNEYATQQSKLGVDDLKRIIKVLGESRRKIDSERLIQIFNGIPSLSRTSTEYQAAVFAYMNLEDFTNALPVLREALSMQDAHALIGSITAKALYLRRWNLAFEVWSMGRTTGSKPLDFLQWQETEYYGVLCERAGLLSTASPIALTSHWKSIPQKLRSHWQEFQQSVVCSALHFGSPSTSSKLVLHLFEQLREWRIHSGELYSNWISKFFASGDNLNALRLYMRARTTRYIPGGKHVVFKVPLELLQPLTQTATRLENLRATQFIHDDLFHFYDGPSLGASQMMLKVFAKHGKLESVQALIDHVFQTFGPPKDCRILTSLLHVHAQRRELAETRAAFESISAKYGLQPNLACYNILIRAYTREDDAESAMEIFSQLRQKTSITDFWSGTKIRKIKA